MNNKYKFNKDIILKFFPKLLHVYDHYEYLWISGSEIFGNKCNNVLLKLEFCRLAVPYKLGLNDIGKVIALDREGNMANTFLKFETFKNPTKYDIETACTHLLEQIKLAKEQLKLISLKQDF